MPLLAQVTPNEVVVGATRRDLEVRLKNFDGTIPDVTGWTCRIQGQSDDLPGLNIDQPGTPQAPGSAGKLLFTGIGAYVSAGQLAPKPSAKFSLRVKVVDGSGEADWTDYFDIEWFATPV